MNREEAIYCLKAQSERYSEVCEECPMYGQTGVDHCCEDALQMAITALQNQPVWIPVSERLPEEHKQYDITTKNEVGIHSDTAIYNPFLGMWFWDEAESEHIEIEVLAWAEKREPYQTKGE